MDLQKTSSKEVVEQGYFVVTLASKILIYVEKTAVFESAQA